jgi:uncharacterized protein YgbK (DUF1537 family)
MSKLKLGCIADDFTGATDLANNLVRSGMRVVQTIGVPSAPLAADVDAVVVALKSRTIPATEAIAQSLEALKWLQAQGAQQIYFKYCSTFDSTPEGNIGPVTEALMDALGTDFTIATPAFPDNEDLYRMGPALKDLPLLTAGSGVAIGLPANFGLKPSLQASQLPAASGLQAVVSGSCSLATNAQVAHFKATGRPAMAIDPASLMNGQSDAVVQQVLAWAAPLLKDGPVLVYSTAEPDAVKAVQAQLGVAEAGALVEHALAAVARGLVSLGVQQLVVAGGETSGACVQALDIAQLQIGPQIDPGVPWCHAPSSRGGVHITLKSGNFGTEDFFTKAFTVLA